MDCEKFDRVILDLLYDELDALTATAARRHMEHCTRCAAIGSELRATREVGQLSLLDPPADLEARILRAERQAHAELPLRERIGRAVSVMAGYAMRPQLAMAALLLLVLASSLLLLRARPGDREAMRVTERGVPESEGEALIVPVSERPAANAPAPGAPPAAGALRDGLGRGAGAESAANEELAEGKPDDADDAKGEDEKEAEADGSTDLYDQAMAHLNEKRFGEAQRDFEAVEAQGGENAASAALLAAQAVLSQSGCSAAAPRFEAVAQRYPGISVAHEATWQAGHCYRSMGETERARQNYVALRSTSGYRDRAQQAIDALEGRATGQTAVASRKAARPAKQAKPAAPPAAAKADKPKAKPGGTASGQRSTESDRAAGF